jgi:hypothetical protein
MNINVTVMICQRDKIGLVIKHHLTETYGGLELELLTFLSRRKAVSLIVCLF